MVYTARVLSSGICEFFADNFSVIDYCVEVLYRLLYFLYELSYFDVIFLAERC